MQIVINAARAAMCAFPWAPATAQIVSRTTLRDDITSFPRQLFFFGEHSTIILIEEMLYGFFKQDPRGPEAVLFLKHEGVAKTSGLTREVTLREAPSGPQSLKALEDVPAWQGSDGLVRPPGMLPAHPKSMQNLRRQLRRTLARGPK